jgi:Glycine-rich domain-containing protein-like
MWLAFSLTFCRRPGLIGNGYGEKDFSYYCERCGNEIDHDMLRVDKFKRDVENLLRSDWPLGGTILHGTKGVPKQIPITDMAFSGTFPNRLIAKELRTQVLELLQPKRSEKVSMASVKALIESSISSESIVRRVNSKPTLGRGGKLNPAERLAIRQMMSRYWDNHRPFAMDLSGAIIRQGTFIDKMHGIDWLHSPAATTTVARLLTKYDRFFRIMATNPGQMCVPTLDVDLGWHTHQLSPRPYYSYSISNTAGDRFVNHDDKVDEDTLSDGFEWTSKQYEKYYGAVYSECTCWYCEGRSILFEYQNRANCL